MTSMRQIVLRAAILAVVACLVGAVFNLVRPAGIEIGRSVVEAKTEALEQLREEALREGPREPRPAGNPGRHEPVPPVQGAVFSNPGWTGTQAAPVRSEDLPFRLDLEVLFELHRSGGVYILDARPDLHYGNGHIQGARLMPPGEYDDRIYDVSAELPAELPIVVYCEGGDCTSSLEVARRLIEDGWSNVHLYEGGFPEWEAAGHAVAEGMEP